MFHLPSARMLRTRIVPAALHTPVQTCGERPLPTAAPKPPICRRVGKVKFSFGDGSRLAGKRHRRESSLPWLETPSGAQDGRAHRTRPMRGTGWRQDGLRHDSAPPCQSSSRRVAFGGPNVTGLSTFRGVSTRESESSRGLRSGSACNPHGYVRTPETLFRNRECGLAHRYDVTLCAPTRNGEAPAALATGALRKPEGASEFEV